jgi:GH15 family glucan-1,4-alpha-glucosidase
LPLRIEDYALIGDCQSAALVGIDGSIDWLCLPRFDSDACFAALLGTDDHGFWRIAPCGTVKHVRRAYRDCSMTLETEMTTDEGTIVLVDFMAVGEPAPDVVRIVVGKSGAVRVRSELGLRFGYGRSVPWVQKIDGGVQAVAGPDLVRFTAPVEMRGESFRTVSEMVVRPGDRVPFVLTWAPSHVSEVPSLDPERALAACDAFWQKWATTCKVEGEYEAIVKRSLLTLKALTYAPTGGMVAAPTTSLPEGIGGFRNWDYRFCWLRDATFTLYALLSAGYTEEAKAWRDWLLRAAAGAPSQLQILYGIAGERRLAELELPWLPGYENSRPVRIGNLASEQLQLDVYGEVMDTLFISHASGLTPTDAGWNLQRALVRHLEDIWPQPDSGIWEVRGPKRHFVHSKVMAWVAFDRAVRSIEKWQLPGPIERWKQIRDALHTEICERGFDRSLNSFVQYYGSNETDASLLMLPLVGFLPADDPRIIGTVRAVEKQLVVDRLVRRYVPHPGVDGLPGYEGAFLACSFWHVDALVLLGRHEEARAHFERLLALANDVGLLAEEYDPTRQRMLGNFPQALSHVALVNSALNLTRARGPAHRRAT